MPYRDGEPDPARDLKAWSRPGSFDIGYLVSREVFAETAWSFIERAHASSVQLPARHAVLRLTTVSPGRYSDKQELIFPSNVLMPI